MKSDLVLRVKGERLKVPKLAKIGALCLAVFSLTVLIGCGGSGEKTVFNEDNMSELSTDVAEESYAALEAQTDELGLSDGGSQALTGNYDSDCEVESSIEARCVLSFGIEDGSALVMEYNVDLREEDSCWDAAAENIYYRQGGVEGMTLDDITEVNLPNNETADFSGCLDAD